MSTAVQTPISTQSVNRVVMHDVPWETYVSLTEIESRHTRIAYDEGVMEIMSPMRAHELAKHLIGRLVEAWSDVKEIDIQGAGSTTVKYDAVSKGFEADESYYIQNVAEVRHLKQIDLSIYPGPDLVIEIDITNSSLRKFSIYSSLRVAEVWRWEEGIIRVYENSKEATTGLHGFVERDDSRVLPGFPLDLAAKIIPRALKESEMRLIREFRQQIQDM